MDRHDVLITDKRGRPVQVWKNQDWSGVERAKLWAKGRGLRWRLLDSDPRPTRRSYR